MYMIYTYILADNGQKKKEAMNLREGEYTEWVERREMEGRK